MVKVSSSNHPAETELAAQQAWIHPEVNRTRKQQIEHDAVPRNCTKVELAKVDVEFVDYVKVKLRCKKCQQTWSPVIKFNGNYWHCPNGCNTRTK